MFNGISHSLTRVCDNNIRIVPVVGVVSGVDTVLIVLTVGVVKGVVVGVLAVDTDAVVSVVITGVLTVDSDSVVNDVGAVVVSETQKRILYIKVKPSAVIC